MHYEIRYHKIELPNQVYQLYSADDRNLITFDFIKSCNVLKSTTKIIGFDCFKLQILKHIKDQ